MRSYLADLYEDFQRDVYVTSWQNDSPRWRAVIVTALEYARHFAGRLTCKVRGHRWHEELVSVESGSSYLWCDRCAETHDIRF